MPENSAFRCELVQNPAPEVIEAVQSILRVYNHTTNPAFFAIVDLPESEKRPLQIVAFDSDARVIAGLLGGTRLAWLMIDILAVAPEHRRTGLGARLVRLAESEGLSRGCRHAYVDTMSYQAPGFYTRLGYSIAGQLHDWDCFGHTKYLFTKRLT